MGGIALYFGGNFLVASKNFSNLLLGLLYGLI